MLYRLVFILLLSVVIGSNPAFSQENKKLQSTPEKKSAKSKTINPLAPAKAAFYSAILPGLGQIHNKKYWKVPLVYGAIGTSLYFYIDSNKKYNQYRDEYKRRLEGLPRGDFFNNIDDSRIISGQKFYQRNRDFSSLFILAFYTLNIIDANVDASLLQFNIDDNLSLRPNVYPSDFNQKAGLALSLNYRF